MRQEVNGVSVCTCNKCNTSWPQRRRDGELKEPRRCPSCHTKKWDAEWFECHCVKCKATFKVLEAPNKCPECKSANWDSKRGER